MARTDKRIPWFKVYTANRGTLEAISSDKLGDALKLALRYFESRGEDASIEQSIRDIETRIAFNTLKQGADDSIKDYADRQADGKRGAEEKRKKAQEQETQLTQMKDKLDLYEKRYGAAEYI